MIEGVVNADYEAVIPLTVQGPAGQAQDIEAVIDTGFTGFLSLPSGVVVALGLPFISASQATLADGSQVTLNAYRAMVLWDGELIPFHLDRAIKGAGRRWTLSSIQSHAASERTRSGSDSNSLR